MREIKVRAWSIKSNCWHYATLATLAMGCFDREGDGFLNYEHWCEYTGLKDKNGKEIYESDIVQEYQMRFEDEGDDWKLLPYDKPDIVTMGRFPIYWLERETFGYEGEDLKGPDDFEVIGNIYENPELLK